MHPQHESSREALRRRIRTRYDYVLDPGIHVRRLISVAPSHSVTGGTSAFLVQVRITNTASAPADLKYAETTRARYQQIFAPWDMSWSEITWSADEPVLRAGKTAVVSFQPRPKRKMRAVPAQGADVAARTVPSGTVRPCNRQRTKHFWQTKTRKAILGSALAGRETSAPDKLTSLPLSSATRGMHPSQRLNASPHPCILPGSQAAPRPNIGIRRTPGGAPSRPSKKNRIRSFAAKCSGMSLYALEAMATWREHYDETVVPQGTSLRLHLGQYGIEPRSCSARSASLPYESRCRQVRPPLPYETHRARRRDQAE